MESEFGEIEEVTLTVLLFVALRPRETVREEPSRVYPFPLTTIEVESLLSSKVRTAE